ncbi:MAG TPA: RDD family protein [Streptosporangiaceae bacterium]
MTYQHPGPPRPVPMEPATDPTIAEWWQRLVARIIDGFAISLLASPVYIAYFAWMFSRMFDAIDKSMQYGTGQQPHVPMFISPLAIFGMSFGIAAAVNLIGFGYDWLCHGKWGMTIGKRIMRLKVVHATDRSRITGTMAAKRALAYPGAAIVPFVGSLFGLVDAIWWFNDKPLHQCLHDKFGETIVIRTDPPRPPYAPPHHPAYAGPPGYPQHQGPPQGPWQAPPQGPRQAPPQGSTQGPWQAPPQGPRQSPHPSQPQSPYEGPPQGQPQYPHPAPPQGTPQGSTQSPPQAQQQSPAQAPSWDAPQPQGQEAPHDPGHAADQDEYGTPPGTDPAPGDER